MQGKVIGGITSCYALGFGARSFKIFENFKFYLQGALSIELILAFSQKTVIYSKTKLRKVLAKTDCF